MDCLIVALIIIAIALLAWWMWKITSKPTFEKFKNESSNEQTSYVLFSLFTQVMFNKRLLMLAYLTNRSQVYTASQQLARSYSQFSDYLNKVYPDSNIFTGNEFSEDYVNMISSSFSLYESVIMGDVSLERQTVQNIKDQVNKYLTDKPEQIGNTVRSLVNQYMDIYVADIKSIINGNWLADTEYTKNMFSLGYSIIGQLMMPVVEKIENGNN